MQRSRITPRSLSNTYSKAHNLMRNLDGLQPQEAFDELLKYLFFKQINEEQGPTISYQYQLLSNGTFSREQEKATKQIRRLFKKYINSVNSWSKKIWSDKSFHLSDKALFQINELFKEVDFSQIPFDIRSEAIKQFIPPEIRKGLGIFLTPDSVVKMMIDVVQPNSSSIVYDIAVGSGTFLIEVVNYWKNNISEDPFEVYGSDKNPRMMLLADLNLGHLTDIKFHKKILDSLFDPVQDNKSQLDWPSPNFFDFIFTNPPFGVIIDSKSYNLSCFETCKDKNGRTLQRQQSEVVFIEQALKFLKPGGMLSIVLPKSIVTNATLDNARKTINCLGYVYAIVVLPPETFQTAGTQTTTILLFIKKFQELENRDEKIGIRIARIENVGYDSTGRQRKGNQLKRASRDIKRSIKIGKDTGLCEVLSDVCKKETLVQLPSLLFGTKPSGNVKRLKDILEVASIGKTPARKSYSDSGLFLVKVGNLTGQGINWVPRDRNFINGKEADKRKSSSKKIMIKINDILLTSSAHSPKYIAKKIDIVSFIPEYVSGEASFVGEIMLLRPTPKVIDPYVLLAFLRMPKTMARIQQMIRGQTAHLHATDILEMPIPDRLFKPDKLILSLAKILREEAQINEKLNSVVHQKLALFEKDEN